LSLERVARAGKQTRSSPRTTKTHQYVGQQQPQVRRRTLRASRKSKQRRVPEYKDEKQPESSPANPEAQKRAKRRRSIEELTPNLSTILERLRCRLQSQEHPRPLPSTSTTHNRIINKSSHDLLALAKPSKFDRKRKHPNQAEHLFSEDRNEPCTKRPRTSSAAGGSNTYSVRHWVQEGNWPQEYFKQGSDMSSRKRSSSSSQQKSDSSKTTFREGKNPATRDRLYEKILAAAKIYMDDSDEIITTDACTAFCKDFA